MHFQKVIIYREGRAFIVETMSGERLADHHLSRYEARLWARKKGHMVVDQRTHPMGCCLAAIEGAEG